jgi:hypothetical protein
MHVQRSGDAGLPANLMFEIAIASPVTTQTRPDNRRHALRLSTDAMLAQYGNAMRHGGSAKDLGPDD